ncbi:MAG: hypothetical protein IPJ30_05770 [Acidobacteria bacterium]|nr:hypothetical protein [Acidobacteriota bacterium]
MPGIQNSRFKIPGFQDCRIPRIPRFQGFQESKNSRGPGIQEVQEFKKSKKAKNSRFQEFQEFKIAWLTLGSRREISNLRFQRTYPPRRRIAGN